MQMKRLGRTDIEVSVLCLGSMTWGTQNTADEGHDQIDRAIEAGVNFVDTAEMYPVNPIQSLTVGRTERIIGLWFEDRGKREDLVIATKHSGEGMQHIRDGAPITAETIPAAIEGSLRRMKTDYIDLYQFHWPNRGSYMFRQNWDFKPSEQDRASVTQNMEDCMGALHDEVNKGRIRAFGLSNESAWGTTQWITASERMRGPRPATIQNEYSLLCRLFDTDLAETSLKEDVGLLAFSPLAAGLLTGKYQNGQVPKGSRMSISAELGGRKTERVFDSVDALLQIAERHGLDPVQMSLAWCLTRPFMTSVIFGATSQEQLELALGAADVTLSPEIMAEISMSHRAFPMPY
ncbi:MAG: aldo/keto reductase [Aliishimia sp.]